MALGMVMSGGESLVQTEVSQLLDGLLDILSSHGPQRRNPPSFGDPLTLTEASP